MHSRSGHLLAQGLARAYPAAGNRPCAKELLDAERVAREVRRGLWADPAYEVREAERAAELGRYRATFQIVEGRIVRVAQVRGMIHLNFGMNWRRAFSVTLRREDRHVLGAHAADPGALEGRRVRVRGWIEQRGGPAIDLSMGGGLELVETTVAGETPAPTTPVRRLRRSARDGRPVFLARRK